MKKQLLMLMACVSLMQLRAQMVFQNEQRFNDQRQQIPLIGFDRIREQNTEIIVQQHPGAPDKWTNTFKFITRHDNTHPGYFTETGEYRFDTFTSVWIGSQLWKYNLSFKPGSNQVLNASIKRMYEDSAHNWSTRCRFIMNNHGKPDSAYYEREMMNAWTPYYVTGHTYDSAGRVIRTGTTYQQAFYYELHTSYDHAGRITDEYSFDQGLMSDSSAHYSYAYDTTGRMVMSLIEVKDLQGSPFVWTTTRKVLYTYDTAGRMTASSLYSYDHEDGYKEVPFSGYIYGYDNNGNLTEMVEMLFSKGVHAGGQRIVLFYSNGHAETGFGFEWNGAAYGFAASSRYIFNSSVTGSAEVSKAGNRNMRVYPNPSSGIIYLEDADNAAITIYTASGKPVLQDVLKDGTMDVSTLPAGLYYLCSGNTRLKLVRE